MLLALLFCYIKIESRYNKAKFAYFIQKITIIYAKNLYLPNDLDLKCKVIKYDG